MVKQDEWGPEKILEVYDAATKMRGFLVIDNRACGPGKGGLRINPDLTVEELSALARTMTWKCAFNELPFGGAFAGIAADTRAISAEEKLNLVRAFARAVKNLSPGEFIAGPDINTAEADMDAFSKEIGAWKAATGKTAHQCDNPLTCGKPHEHGTTGFGVAIAAAAATDSINLDIRNATVAIEGFGSVGIFAAKKLSDMGARIVAVSDSQGCIYSDKIDFEKLLQTKKETGSVVNYRPAEVVAHEKIFDLPVSVLIPAALANVITVTNAPRVRAKIIVEAANMPITEEVEKLLHPRVLVVPDIVANAGGLVSSYLEYSGRTAEDVFKIVEEKIKKNTNSVLSEAKKKNIEPRYIATDVAKIAVMKAIRNKK